MLVPAKGGTLEEKIKELRQIVEEFANDNPKLSKLLVNVLDEIERDKDKFVGQDISVIINQMRRSAIDEEVLKFAGRWFVDEADVRYEAFHFRDGELANENKFKEKADFAAYKAATPEAMPKFKFYGALIRDFKDNLMPAIAPLLE